jgi:hypothetical protein
MASQRQYAPSISTLVEEDEEGVVQEIGVTRVPLSQWRKVKTRAGIVPWLKVYANLWYKTFVKDIC